MAAKDHKRKSGSNEKTNDEAATVNENQQASAGCHRISCVLKITPMRLYASAKAAYSSFILKEKNFEREKNLAIGCGKTQSPVEARSAFTADGLSQKLFKTIQNSLNLLSLKNSTKKKTLDLHQ